ncbi:hypothetical protein [uncultured Bacteroides sp.]|uniref:hypothetical protein n=1 Tax=uncultured Bacteroides sp. TaxID=162156 RepID=UPI002606A8D7|nr:hypothetical protein [uncultured Bacteroides sp.]
MKDTNINGVILNEDISKRLAKLQNGNAKTLAGYLDDSVSMLLENSHYFSGDERNLLDVLSTLHIVRNELLGLIPESKGGEQ